MKKKYHHLANGTFRNPEGSKVIDMNFNWSFKVFNQEKKKLDMTFPESNIIKKEKVLLDLNNFQKEDYVRARSSMEEAIRLAEEEGYRPKENWYVLLAACFNELKDRKVISASFALEQQLVIYEILVNYYPKKLYFLQLGGTYQQMDREEDYMITLKAAFNKDLLDKEGEYLALAQLLLLNKNPYWAAQVLSLIHI